MKTAIVRRAIICLLGSILLLIPVVTNAQIPQTVNYQGYLTDAATGNPVDTGAGTIDVEFSLYDVSGGGAAVWTSTQAVTVKEGVYSVTFSGLGGLDFDSQYYLQVAFDENHNSTIEPAEILSPRQPFTAVPYAINAERLDGKHAADLGDITAVNPGTGLSGGGASGDVTLSANTTYLQRRVTGTCAGQVIVGVNANGTVTCEPDDGITTETDPTVNALGKASLSCTNGQVAKWNGTVWACSNETDPQVGANITNYVPKWNGSALATGTIYDDGNIGIGTTPTAGYKLDVAGSVNLNKGIASGIALRVNGKEALWSDGNYFSWGWGGNANAFDDSVGIGVYPPYTSKLTVAGTIDGSGTVAGDNSSTAGSSSGLVGRITSSTPGGYSAGVRGVNNGTAGYGIGVYGSQAGGGWGVYGETPNGRGVYGIASGSSGVNYGVYGQTNSGSGYAGYFDGRVTATGTIESTGGGIKFPDGTTQTTAVRANPVHNIWVVPHYKFRTYNCEVGDICFPDQEGATITLLNLGNTTATVTIKWFSIYGNLDDEDEGLALTTGRFVELRYMPYYPYSGAWGGWVLIISDQPIIVGGYWTKGPQPSGYANRLSELGVNQIDCTNPAGVEYACSYVP